MVSRASFGMAMVWEGEGAAMIPGMFLGSITPYRSRMEGPSIAILVEECRKFLTKRVVASSGNSKALDIPALRGQRLIAVRSWGKHFLMQFEKVNLRVHFMLFGSYRVDERREGRVPRLALRFRSGELNMYACSVRVLERHPSELYDWSADVMSAAWDEAAAIRKLRKLPRSFLCDVLLDQTIFAGVGNIIKNEVLFRLRLHPEVRLSRLNIAEIRLAVREARLYCFQFYEWKKRYELRKNWQVYRKKTCPVCGRKITVRAAGRSARRSFWCGTCQKQRLRAAKVPSRTAALRSRLAERAALIAEYEGRIGAAAVSGAEREHDS